MKLCTSLATIFITRSCPALVPCCNLPSLSCVRLGRHCGVLASSQHNSSQKNISITHDAITNNKSNSTTDNNHTSTGHSSSQSPAEHYPPPLISRTTVINDGSEDITVDMRPKFAHYLSREVREALKAKLYKPNRHPGIRDVTVQSMPEGLKAAMEIVLEDSGMKRSELEAEARLLAARVWSRLPPKEDTAREAEEQAALVEIVNNEPVDPMHPEVLEVDRRMLLQDRNKQLKWMMRKGQRQSHQPLDLSTKRSCLVYLLCRLEGEYAALVKVLSQLHAADPEFVPSTVLDFGAGVGSVNWAVDKVFPNMCREMFNVDSSAEMNLLNETLQRDGHIDNNLKRRPHSTYFRQYMPASATIKYDLVVASRSLFELSSSQMRVRTLDILWRTVQPGGCLVLVECGNTRGCQVMLEARHFLLEAVQHPKARVIAPCPHQYVCPLLEKQARFRICTDSVQYLNCKNIQQKELFSYLVFQKPKRFEVDEAGVGSSSRSWPRIVQPVLCNTGHAVLKVCNKYGNLQELSTTKAKHGAVCTKVARASKLGDLYPVELLPLNLTVEIPGGGYKQTSLETASKQQEELDADWTDVESSSGGDVQN